MDPANISDPVAAAALIQEFLANAPVDTANEYLTNMKLTLEASKVKRQIEEVRVDLAKVLADVVADLLGVIPVGRTVKLYHRAATEAKDGVPAIPAGLEFNLEVSASVTTNGRATASRTTGKTIRAMLDGKPIEGSTYRGCLDKVNEALLEKERCKIPNSAFSANRELNAFAARLNKASGKERLVVVGEVMEAPAPVPEGPKDDASTPPPASTAPEGPEAKGDEAKG